MLDELRARQALVDCRITYAEILRARGELEKGLEQALMGLRESRDLREKEQVRAVFLDTFAPAETG